MYSIHVFCRICKEMILLLSLEWNKLMLALHQTVQQFLTKSMRDCPLTVMRFTCVVNQLPLVCLLHVFAKETFARSCKIDKKLVIIQFCCLDEGIWDNSSPRIPVFSDVC